MPPASHQNKLKKNTLELNQFLTQICNISFWNAKIRERGGAGGVPFMYPYKNRVKNKFLFYNFVD